MYAKCSPVLSDIPISIIADRGGTTYHASVDKVIEKKREGDYWRLFQEEADLYDLIMITFNWIIPTDICSRYSGRMVNQHPSLLPAFPGIHVEKNILESGALFSGTTFHMVTPELDNGPIIAQSLFPIQRGIGENDLKAENWKQTKDLFVQVIRWFADKRIQMEGRRVSVENARYTGGSCGCGACQPALEIPLGPATVFEQMGMLKRNSSSRIDEMAGGAR